MTICDVYLGDLGDPTFKWDGGDWNGNIPKAVLKNFPSAPGAYNAKFHSWLKTKPEIKAKQTDFGGWVAQVTKDQVLDYLTYAYEPDFLERWPADAMAIKRMRNALNALPESAYGLVATEF